jgi:hypothetical protein
MRFFVAITLLSTLFSISVAVTPKSGNNDGSLTNDYQYKTVDKKILEECIPCSFLEMKSIEECMITGYIQKEQITREKENDPKDQHTIINYTRCEPTGIRKYSLYIFVLLLFVALKVLIGKLNLYRGELENKIYQKLSLSKN